MRPPVPTSAIGFLPPGALISLTAPRPPLPGSPASDMDTSFVSAVVILLLVMDPIGNIPLFVSLLRNVEPRRRVRVIVRECLIAFGVLIGFALFGKSILDLFGISDP